MAIKLPNGKIARTIAEQVYKNMKDIAFLLSKKDFQILVVDELPEEGSENTLYLVPSDNPEQQNVYTEYIWTGSAFEMVGTTAIDISNMVTTDTNQNIIGEKVFEAPVTFYDIITLNVDAAFEGDVLPNSTDSYDLGSATYTWHSLYLSNDLSLSSAQAASPAIKLKNSYTEGTLKLSGYSFEVSGASNFIPYPNNTIDLGNSSYAWKDLYIGGTAYVPIIDSSSILFKINGNSRYYFNDSAIFPANNNLKDLGGSGNLWKDLYLGGSINGSGSANLDIKNSTTTLRVQPNGFVASDYFIPITNNGGDLGVSGSAWRNLYLAGNLTDGTNSVNVADLKALIDYAKAQGWIS